MVAEATSALCEAANAAVQGNASQEKLIASAQAVSASTAQLLLACRVKADPNSKAQRGLQVNYLLPNIPSLVHVWLNAKFYHFSS